MFCSESHFTIESQISCLLVNHSFNYHLKDRSRGSNGHTINPMVTICSQAMDDQQDCRSHQQRSGIRLTDPQIGLSFNLMIILLIISRKWWQIRAQDVIRSPLSPHDRCTRVQDMRHTPNTAEGMADH